MRTGSSRSLFSSQHYSMPSMVFALHFLTCGPNYGNTSRRPSGCSGRSLFRSLALLPTQSSFRRWEARMAAKSRTLPLAKRGLNFEMFMWMFTRLSALAMYGLILVAVIGALIMGARNQMSFADILRWGFMPNPNHVQSTNVPELEPWAGPFWKITASLLLIVAVAHGVHGLVVIA